MTTGVVYRGARSTDAAYVTNSWVTSLLGPVRQWGERGLVLNKQVDALLNDERTNVIVACQADDEDRIIGWIAYAHPPGCRLLEFVHVRRARRREGVATKLVSRAGFPHRESFVTLFDSDEAAKAFIVSLGAHHTRITPEDFLP